jgi:DNA-binding transcriptional MerR regulator
VGTVPAAPLALGRARPCPQAPRLPGPPSGHTIPPMPTDDLTPSQVAALLDVDASTLRRWARAWKVHLSEQGQAKRRRYTQGDLATFARGRDLLRAGKSPAEVGTLLGIVPTVPAEVPAVATVSLPAIAQELQAALDTVRALVGQVDELRATQEAQAAQLARVQAQLEAWKAAPWWRRLFRRP